MTLQNAHEYAQSQASRLVADLVEWLKIPSVSTDPAFAPQVRRAAEWALNYLRGLGLETELIETQRHPLVLAQWLKAGADKPTVLIYGHYDVQPAQKSDGWDTEPFEPLERDGILYARGATDDKGQAFAQLAAVEAWLKGTGALPVNVKIILEGEEESGGESIAKFVREQGARLSADVCVLSDTSMASIERPVITFGVRGIVGMELVVTGPATDLHSGMYGGTVLNPLKALADILSQMHDAEGRVTVPHFYDSVLPLSEAERQAIAQAPYTPEDWYRETGAPAEWGEQGYTTLERIGARPTFEINGISGGYAEAGFKAVIPAKAVAKVSCRLVADQDPQRVYEQLKAYIAQITPPQVSSELKYIAGSPGATVNVNAPAMRAAIAAYEKGWGAKPVFKREGGSLPIVADLQKHLHMPVIMMGFGLNSDGLHGPNEHFSLAMFQRGIQTAIHFLAEMAQL